MFKWFYRISAQTRLMLLLALLIAAAAWYAGDAIVKAVRYQQQLSELNAAMQSAQRRSDALSAFLAEQLSLSNVLLDQENASDNSGEVLRLAESFDTFLSYELGSADEEELPQVEELADLRANYDRAVEILFEAMEGQITPQAAAELKAAEIDPTGLQLSGQLIELIAADRLAARWYAAELQDSARAVAQSGSLAFILLGLLLVTGAGMINDIFEPLFGLSNALVQFEKGAFRREMLQAHQQRADELGQLMRSFSDMAASIQESNRLKAQFLESAARFIPTEYLEFLSKGSITEVNLGDNVAAEMAVMFSDIRGFTSMSESMTPQQNFDFINEYLQLVSPIIQDNEGFIVKFLGDGMMAIFPYGVEDALRAGIQKQLKVQEFNAELARRGYPPLNVGIGVHVGQMMVGMIGEQGRIQGDAFSDNVNLTSRLEGLNKFYGTSMIVSEDVLSQVKERSGYQMRYLGKAVVKGRQAPLGLYEFYSGLAPDVVKRREASRNDFERGIALYAQGQFLAALSAFEAALALDADDKTAQYYAGRCRGWLESGQPTAPPGWNGALSMDEK